MELPSALRAPAALRLPAAEAVRAARRGRGQEAAVRSLQGRRRSAPPKPLRDPRPSARSPDEEEEEEGGAKTNVSHNALWMEVIQRGLLGSTGNFLWNR